MSQSEEQRILEEVKRRKERARHSGVIARAFDLYMHDLPYYDAWATNCPDLVHPAITITDKVRTGGGNNSADSIAATIRGNNYLFTFRESTTYMPDGRYTRGYLDVDFKGHRVLTIDCRCHDDDYAGRTWSAGDVSAFLEGPWIAELNSVSEEVASLHAANRGRAEERSKKHKLEELKKNFGL